MKSSLLAVGLLFVSFSGFAQTSTPATPQGFGLKNDTIGESLNDFRTRNATTSGTGSDALYPRCSGDAPGEKPAFPKTIQRQEWETYREALSVYETTHDV